MSATQELEATQAPVPVAALAIDDLVGTLRELRLWAGEPSYATIARRISQARLARGVPASEATPGRITVYDCFRDGRRRLDVDLVLDIVAALGADKDQRAAWRQALRRVLSPGAGPGLADVLRDPPPLQPFVGRAAECQAILTAAAQGPVVLDGMPGVGKSALAIQAAHELAAALAGDQRETKKRQRGEDQVPVLLVNLRGFAPDQQPVEPDSVADALLRELGAESPPQSGQRLTRLRAVLAHQRVVVILDDAGSADQVAPLLPPPASHSRMIITSRQRLDLLPEVQEVHVGALTSEYAVELLGHSLGAQGETTTAESSSGQSALQVLAQLAGGLPLALSLMARRLSAQPDWSLQDHVESYRGRLELLQLDEGLQAALELSYGALQPTAQQVLRAMSWPPVPSLGEGAIRALTQTPPAELAGLLAVLDSARLIRCAGPGRWELHDLVRTFAASRSFDVDSPTRRSAALRRWSAHLVEGAAHAVGLIHPHARRDWWWEEDETTAASGVSSSQAAPQDAIQAATWLDRERAGIIACASWAAQQGEGEITIQLAAVLAHDLLRRGDIETTLELHRTAILCAARLEHDLGRAVAERNLANTLIRAGRFTAAEPHVQTARSLFDRLDHHGGRLSSLSSAAILASAIGDQETAIAHFEGIVALLRGRDESHDRLAQALSNLAVSTHRAGRVEEAADLFAESAALAAEHGLPEQERVALSNLAAILVEEGQAERGLDVAQRALDLTKVDDDPLALGYAQATFGAALHATGEHEQAFDEWERALELSRAVDAPDLEASVLNHIGDGHRTRGQVDSARTAYRNALSLAVRIGEANEEQRAREGLSQL